MIVFSGTLSSFPPLPYFVLDKISRVRMPLWGNGGTAETHSLNGSKIFLSCPPPTDQWDAM